METYRRGIAAGPGPDLSAKAFRRKGRPDDRDALKLDMRREAHAEVEAQGAMVVGCVAFGGDTRVALCGLQAEGAEAVAGGSQQLPRHAPPAIRPCDPLTGNGSDAAGVRRGQPWVVGEISVSRRGAAWHHPTGCPSK